jgi:S1-C subfamily serine protease
MQNLSFVQRRPDFTGLWQADLQKSTMRGLPPREILMKIEHREPHLVQKILVRYPSGDEQRLTLTYETTGNETTNSVRGGTARTRAHWDGAELVIESSMKTPTREFHFKDHWSLSDDGQMLTMAHRDDDLAGQIVVHDKASPEVAAKFVGWDQPTMITHPPHPRTGRG